MHLDLSHVMTLQVLRALDLCREFRRLDDHIARIAAEIPELHGKRAAFQRVLDGLIQHRVLVSDADYAARLSRGAAREQPPLGRVFIRACDRPDRLAYLLASLVDYSRWTTRCCCRARIRRAGPRTASPPRSRITASRIRWRWKYRWR